MYILIINCVFSGSKKIFIYNVRVSGKCCLGTLVVGAGIDF